MRFQYPLQKIVDLKGSEKSMAEWEYASSLDRLREQQARLSELIRERSALEDMMSQTTASAVTLAELAGIQRYLDMIDHKIRRQTDGVETADALVRMKQNRLLEKSVDEKVWLNARDKAFQHFRSERLVKEQNELDEMAMVRASAARA